MMDDNKYQAALQKQHAVTTEAAKSRVWRTTTRSINEKAARFPGFFQRTLHYKSGQQVVPGGLALPSDIIMHESVPMLLRDGTKLYSDVFLPGRFSDLTNSGAPIPAIVAWSPYGKQGGTTLLDDFPFRAGVPRHWLSGLEKWEGPDPAYWCEHDYAIINVDVRGAYTSEGDLTQFGHDEAQDGADFVTWVSEQKWCNGKVALTGNSWLGITQWGIGSLRPKGLAALAPWEGFHDFYRHHMCPGGIPFIGFNEDIIRTLATQGRIEDAGQYLAKHPHYDTYWEEKRTHPEWISLPTYVVSSWTNPVHTPGTLKAWNLLPSSIPKWLRIHNSQEWPDYYNEDSRADLRRFYDYYLHGKTDNGWDQTPRVRVSVLNMGLKGAADIVNRPESSFPLARTRYTKYFLQPDNSLSLHPSNAAALSYESTTGNLVFEYEMPLSIETTGYFMAHLLVSSTEHDEVDVFVQVEKLSPNKYREGTLCLKPQSLVLQRLMKFIHDWQIGLGTVGMAFHWGPDGQFRASHSGTKIEEMSEVAQPFYSHTESKPLKHEEVRAIDVPMRPYGMLWEKGSILRFTIAGKMILPFAIPGLKMHETNNKGVHNIHCGDVDGEEGSYLLLPHV